MPNAFKEGVKGMSIVRFVMCTHKMVDTKMNNCFYEADSVIMVRFSKNICICWNKNLSVHHRMTHMCLLYFVG